MLIPRIKPILNKRLKQLQRDCGDEKYREWRKYVLNRDKNKCQMPGCSRCLKLEVHHIKRFADRPSMKLEKFNGITLCSKCHKSIHNREAQYELIFLRIVRVNENKQQSPVDENPK